MNTTQVKLTQVAVNAANPRKISDKRFAKLVNSILILPKMLNIRPIVVDNTMTALGGNMRYRALCAIADMSEAEIAQRVKSIKGIEKRTQGELEALLNHWFNWKDNPIVDVIKADDLSEVEAREFIIKDNVEAGEWDMDELANEWDLSELEEWDVPIPADLLNTEDVDVEDTEDDFDEETDEVKARCKLGDIWQLGEHRLMCGDSTNVDEVKRLMGGALADMWLTDPLYNVALGYEGSASEARQRHRRTDHKIVLNDSMPDADFRQFLVNAYTAAKESMKEGAIYYIWHADNESYNFRGALRDVGDMKLRETLIWVKDSFTLGRQDYQWKHEPCLYGWKEGGSHNWYNDRKQSTCLEFPKPKVSKEHPTMKPVPLFAYLVGNSSQKGEVVLDTFGGSGTTLIACEQLGRKARLMELSPQYCDVIIARWEKLTGKTATKIEEA